VSFYGIKAVVRTKFGLKMSVKTNSRIENEIFILGNGSRFFLDF